MGGPRSRRAKALSAACETLKMTMYWNSVLWENEIRRMEQGRFYMHSGIFVKGSCENADDQ